MITSSKSNWNPKRLDVRSFAQAGGQLGMAEGVGPLERLNAECAPGTGGLEAVSWQVHGEMRTDSAGKPQPWIRVQAGAALSVVCQRCLGPVKVALEVDRWYRFVADETTAEAEDEDSEEDVLALEPKPDLWMLLEDELLMALPLVPMHDVCPEPVVMSVADEEVDRAEDEAPAKNPFAALARLKK